MKFRIMILIALMGFLTTGCASTNVNEFMETQEKRNKIYDTNFNKIQELVNKNFLPRFTKLEATVFPTPVPAPSVVNTATVKPTEPTVKNPVGSNPLEVGKPCIGEGCKNG